MTFFERSVGFKKKKKAKSSHTFSTTHSSTKKITHPFSKNTPIHQKTYPFTKKHTHSPKNIPILQKTYPFSKKHTHSPKKTYHSQKKNQNTILCF
jgi:hypothetical protein